MSIKPIIAAVLASTLVAAGTVLPTLASDDFYYFKFTLGAYQDERVTGYRYRQTNSTNNPWKVGVYTSTEENWSWYTAYMTGQKNYAAATNRVTVYAGPSAPWVYSSTYWNANQTNVRLHLFNPERTRYQPVIDGWWDEETW